MSDPSPRAEYLQEIRFAVVMYGGVSLAIYINGIAQELLRMVRSTSTASKDAQGNDVPIASSGLKGTEKVYRRLSCLLSDPQLLRQYRESLETNGADPDQPEVDIVDQRVAEEIINTRFIVDILSGTSAGGINAIYLAKALANDQNLDELKELWVTEGDIGLLINDKQSVAGLHLTNQSPPQSLLNSRRLYFKLLNALHGMEKGRQSKPAFDSPHVDELDLFITTTDIEGLPLPLRLSDTVVYERRHRNVFHFRYGTRAAIGYERNDFLADNDPFLAFAARCTSSFPFAFEPMRLCDIDEVLDRFPAYDNKEKRKDSVKAWTPFFGENVHPLTKKTVDYSQHSYVDGSYLYNKPFTYTTEALTRRDAPVPVDRKLIYIEPSPEHPEDEPPRKEKYQALENVKAALLDLPTYETIREDLQRLIERNELLKRGTRITRLIEGDLAKAQKERTTLGEGEWVTLDLADMAKRFGVYYIPYRRLRIASTTDELAKLIARRRGLDDNSAQFTAVRFLIHAWRDAIYPDYKRKPGNQAAQTYSLGKATSEKTPNQFLQDFDFPYWLRRITFARNKVDELYGIIRIPMNNAGDTANISADDLAVLKRLKELEDHPLDCLGLTTAEKRQLQLVLSFLKSELNELYKKIRMGGRRIAGRRNEDRTPDEVEFAKAIESIKLENSDIRDLLGLPKPKDSSPNEPIAATQEEFSRLDDYEGFKRAKQKLFSFDGKATALGESIIKAGDALAKLFFNHVADPAWKNGSALLRPTSPLPKGTGRFASIESESEYVKSVREYLWNYFCHFDDYDQISFPILYGNEVGEADVVEILRISPEDATSLINERSERLKPNGRTKLAGTALHHFGAFLDKVWRQNDILWGRLDGAERLITALLPNYEDTKVREKLINEAHSAIVFEELTPETNEAIGMLLTDALIRISAGDDRKTAVARAIKPVKDEMLRTRLTKIMRAGIEHATLLAFIRSNYEVNRDLDQKLMLRSISRSTQIIGKMFHDMPNQHNLEGKSLARVSRLGQVFWGLVEVAVPGSLLNLLFFHWLKILYVFEVFLIVGAILLNADKAVTNFGWSALGITATINVVVLLLSDYIPGRQRALRVVVALIPLFVS